MDSSSTASAQTRSPHCATDSTMWSAALRTALYAQLYAQRMQRHDRGRSPSGASANPLPSGGETAVSVQCFVEDGFSRDVCWFVFSHHVSARGRARALRSQGAHMQRPPIDFEEHVHLARSSGAIIINKLESQAAQLEQARTMLWPWLHASGLSPSVPISSRKSSLWSSSCGGCAQKRRERRCATQTSPTI